MTKALIKIYQRPVAFVRNSNYRNQYLVILMPLLITITYLFVFSVEKYMSSTTYIIRDNHSKESFGIDLGIFGGGASSNKQDSGILEKYLNSYDTLNLVDKKFNLNQQFHSSKTDMLERLTLFSSREDLINLYRKNLSVVHDDITGLTTLSYMDPAPEQSRAVVSYILKLGEEFLNTLNRNNAEKKIAFIKEQLNLNKGKLDEAIDKLEQFQNSHKIVDPKADIEVQYAIIANLEKLLIEKNAERNQLANFMNHDSIDVSRLDGELKEIRTGLKKTRSRLSGEEKSRLNDLIFQFDQLKSEVDFTSEIYKKTMVQFEVSRIEALQEAKILEVITTPTLPDEYAYPKKLKTIATVFFLLLVFFKVTQLVIAVIQDHKD